MTPKDLVWDTVYRESLKAGASERAAKDQAVMAVEDYGKGKFSKVDALVKKHINLAKKRSKKHGKR